VGCSADLASAVGSVTSADSAGVMMAFPAIAPRMTADDHALGIVQDACSANGCAVEWVGLGHLGFETDCLKVGGETGKPSRSMVGAIEN